VGDGGSPITAYTITPYVGTTAQPSTTITGTPPATTLTVTGLTNGTTYTFTVTATNSLGSGTPSSPSNAITPSPAPPVAFVQQAVGHGSGTTRSVTLASAVASGDRIVVEVSIWAANHPTASSVTDSAGNTYTSVLRFTASDGDEESIWTAPITAGGGTKPTITATSTSSADMGVAALEYSGLSTAASIGAVDVTKSATGTTTAAATVFSGPVPAATANGLAIGFYADSGFGSTLAASAGFTSRASISGSTDMDLLVEDQVVSAGATPNAGAATSGNTNWLMSTVVFTSAAGTTPIRPGAPTAVNATAGDSQATVAWTAPSNGGSPLTAYTVTPYIGTTAQPSTTVTGTPPATTVTVAGLTNGTVYTFTVAATNLTGTGSPSAPSNSVTPTAPTAPTAPAAPTGVTAAPGNARATVTWTSPSNGGSAITSYTVTPYVAGVAQPATTLTGSPPATAATITGLTNGVTYTFTVSATNVVGAGPASAPSNSTTPNSAPQFVQSITAHGSGSTSRTATLPAAITTGDRIVVEVGVWSSTNATASTVTDSAGNTYTEVLHFTASDATEESVWTAPITAGGGTKPNITVTTSKAADAGIAALEYSGLSAVSGAGAVDVSRTATGTAAAAGTVFSGATAAATTAGLALGFYADSGFGVSPVASSGFTPRATISNVTDMDLLAEDQPSAVGAAPSAGATTKAGTIWLISTVVFKGA